MRINCSRLNYKWENYSTAVKSILEDKNLGVLVFAEDKEGKAVGFMFVTYEWCDWRVGIFFWLQAIFATHDEIIPLLKDKLKEYAETQLGHRWCGIRLAHDKRKQESFEPAIKHFEMVDAHY